MATLEPALLRPVPDSCFFGTFRPVTLGEGKELMRYGMLLAILVTFLAAGPVPAFQSLGVRASGSLEQRAASEEHSPERRAASESRPSLAKADDAELDESGFSHLKILADIVSFLSDAFTIVASGIAIYLYFFKRREIKSAFDALTAFAQQASMFELTQKLETINTLNARNADEKAEIIATFHDICGHLEGNPKLKHSCADIVIKIRKATGSKGFGEPFKRSLVSELRESLRHINAGTFAAAIGEDTK